MVDLRTELSRIQVDAYREEFAELVDSWKASALGRHAGCHYWGTRIGREVLPETGVRRSVVAIRRDLAPEDSKDLEGANYL